jgi:carnitine O-acetyltransferase
LSNNNHDDGDHHETKSNTVLVEPIFQEAWESLTRDQQNHLQASVQQARQEVSKRIKAMDLLVLEYTLYGAKAIQQARYPPDAFGQMAMQLASYRAFNDQQTVATYESTQTRQFLHGLPETTRSVSPASVAFVQAMMVGDNNNKQEREALLQEAVDQHSQYARDASQGLGVDRHFMGLAMMMQHGETAPDLFQNPTMAFEYQHTPWNGSWFWSCPRKWDWSWL